MRKPVSCGRRKVLELFWGAIATLTLSPFSQPKTINASQAMIHKTDLNLPKPFENSGISLEYTIKKRRTIRRFNPKPLTALQLSQLLWAAQGITEEGGFKRAAPSGGALYPIDVYTAVGKRCIKGFESGLYLYRPRNHSLIKIQTGDLRKRLAKAALHQMWMANAPINLIITAEYGRSTKKYGKRGVQYTMIEAGHIGQNIFLQAEALSLGAGIVGAFYREKIQDVLKVPIHQNPLTIMPIGHKG